MTSIARVRIRSFKAIDSLEFKPGQINLITGKNNTGKTSFLESIDLAFNPNHINRFSDNLDSLINVKENSSSIDIEYRKSGQLQLGDFDKKDIDISHRELALHHPREEQAFRIFDELLRDGLIDGREKDRIFSPAALERITDAMEKHTGNLDKDEIVDKLYDALNESIDEQSKALIPSDIERSTIVVQVDGMEYEFISIDDEFKKTKQLLREDAINRIEEDYLGEEPDLTEEEIKEFELGLARLLDIGLMRQWKSTQFIGYSPEKINSAKLIQSPSISPAEVDMSEENAAIKLDEVESYIKENKILDGLRSLSFNKIVFENENGKYEIPYKFMGDGFKTLVGILWEVFSEKSEGQVMLLEEPDRHMHPGYVGELSQELINVCKRKNLQLFITTHDADFINSFFEEYIQSDHEDYLSEKFKILQLTDGHPRSMNYKRAETELDELNADLRGI